MEIFMKSYVMAGFVVAGLTLCCGAHAQNGGAGGGPGGAATRASPSSAPGSTVAPTMPGTPTGHMPNEPSPAASGYATEAAAKAACGDDTVVWGNTTTKAMTKTGTTMYGQAPGAYMCLKQAVTDGYAEK